jgi:hypothetical protein
VLPVGTPEEFSLDAASACVHTRGSYNLLLIYIPNASVDSYLPGRLVLLEQGVREGFQCLQTSIERARVDSLNRWVYAGKMLCELFGLLDTLRRQGRVCWNPCRCPHRGSVLPRLGIHAPVRPELWLSDKVCRCGEVRLGAAQWSV